MPQPQQTYVRIHRFHDLVAFDMDATETLYLSPGLARQFGNALRRYAADCERTPFTESMLGNLRLEDRPANPHHAPPPSGATQGD